MNAKLKASYGNNGNIRLIVVIGSLSHIVSWETGKVVTVAGGHSDFNEAVEIQGCDPAVLCASVHHLAQVWGACDDTVELFKTVLVPQMKTLPKLHMEQHIMTAKKAAKTTAKLPAKKAAKKAVVKKEAAAKPAAEKVEKTTKSRVSVSSRIKELILEGALSDDKIFAKVQKEFELDDSKRGYVAWNRSDLRRKGMTVPDAVAA